MPGGRCSPCHPTTAARSLPVPPGFLSVPRAKDALEARAHSPSPHSEPAAAICQLLLFPKKNPAPDPGLSGSERPRLQGRGNGLSIAAGRAPSRPPRPLCSPFPTFSDGTADVPAGSSPGNQPAGDGAQRYRGAAAPGLCPCGVAGELRHRRRLGTESWHHPRCRWQPGLAH